MGEMKRAIAREEQDRRTPHDRYVSTLAISASIIAAVRLAREDVSRQTPRVVSAISDSVLLARMILDRVLRF